MFPLSSDHLDGSVNLVVYGVIVIGAVVGSFFVRYRRKHRQVDLAGTSVLLGYNTIKTLNVVV